MNERRCEIGPQAAYFRERDQSARAVKADAARIRQLGVKRILYGTDAATGGNLPPREACTAFRCLSVPDDEFRTIAGNVLPHLC